MKTPLLCIYRSSGHLTLWVGLRGWRWWGFYWDGGLRMHSYTVLA